MSGDLKALLARSEREAVGKRLAVVCADDPHTLEAVAMAAERGVIRPLLIGDEGKIRGRLEMFPALADCRLIHAADEAQAAREGAALVRDGEAEALMKGHMETATLLREVVRKENGICASGIISHLCVAELSSYPKLLGITDGALLTYPTLEQKAQAIRNAVGFMAPLVDGPVRVACLAAVEVVNPKMKETVEARQLQELFAGDPACIVEGPLSYDLAVEPAAIREKEFYHSQVAGRADLLLAPDLIVGNVLHKALIYSAGATGVGLIVGARVPVVLTSRSSSTRMKYESIVLAVS